MSFAHSNADADKKKKAGSHKGTAHNSVPQSVLLSVLLAGLPLRHIVLVLILDKLQSMALFTASPSFSVSRAATSL